ncbi:cell division protein FtsW [Sphingomonas gilva]|uniref:Probable peptidoglycan glycosyltransferase FtsW n=1 Tax=Sphingomonas gilva TaxID=2305907 RepID=A0A396RNH0_9SPHN|nr:cell division protein FtsW [Sphingomonas gilva]
MTTTETYGAGRTPTRFQAKIDRWLGRSEQTAVGRWFWEIDRVLLLLVLLLIAIGLVSVAAASPASAQRYSGGSVTFAPLTFFWKQLMWVAVSLPVMLAVSMLPITLARRAALMGAAFFSILLILTPIIGVEVNGAKRWIGVGISQFQPSEFLKPLYVIAMAWILSLRATDRTLPVVPITGAMTLILAAALMKQPDLGQTVIFLALWVTLLIISGTSMKFVGALGGMAVAGLVCAYLFYDTARLRIDGFLFSEGDTYQTDMAHATITAGGLLGSGPGGGEAKFRLPEAHTDYVFSVIGEEFGLIACMGVALVFLAIVVRVFLKLLDEQDEFKLLAAAGLAVQFGLQAFINMAVNVQIAPSKGMTLPFISYGGSSMIALSMGMGLLLAFTRRNPYLNKSPYIIRWSGR